MTEAVIEVVIEERVVVIEEIAEEVVTVEMVEEGIEKVVIEEVAEEIETSNLHSSSLKVPTSASFRTRMSLNRSREACGEITSKLIPLNFTIRTV